MVGMVAQRAEFISPLGFGDFAGNKNLTKYQSNQYS